MPPASKRPFSPTLPSARFRAAARQSHQDDLDAGNDPGLQQGPQGGLRHHPARAAACRSAQLVGGQLARTSTTAARCSRSRPTCPPPRRRPPPPAAPVAVDLGLLTNINNDHDISPDGKLLAVSDQSQGNHQSAIWVLPIEGAGAGAAPRRLTEKTPSYFHGWSPDGKTLAFCGKRGNAFNIYTISARRRRRKATHPTARARTTAPNTPATGSSSTSTPTAPVRCRSGG